MICAIEIMQEQIEIVKEKWKSCSETVLFLTVGIEVYNVWHPKEDIWEGVRDWKDKYVAAGKKIKGHEVQINDWKIAVVEANKGIKVMIEFARHEGIKKETDIFEVFNHVLEAACSNKNDAYRILPEKQYLQRKKVNNTDENIELQCLHQGLFTGNQKRDKKTALIWYQGKNKQKMSYQSLRDETLKAANLMQQHGVNKGDKVAVLLPKGVEQILMVLGVLSLGAAYVPISYDQPMERVYDILNTGEVKYIVTDHKKHTQFLGRGTVILGSDYVNYDTHISPVFPAVKETAYIIFTSGSTGIPKGVVISHENACNTIADMNKRFSVTAEDSLLAVSELSFDLSVYDLFGMLECGGCFVLPSESDKKEPHIWYQYIKENKITVWNSVPALYEMLLMVMELRAEEVSLKKVFLSGDWIKLELYQRTCNWIKNCRFIALGGATEAGIWSNYYEVEEIKPDWSAIPYGVPLGNQKMRVVDLLGRDCPDHVPGELWLGGRSVGQKYINMHDLTKEKFIEMDGTRWYLTGDMAQYMENGIIEFLGRIDQQVKVNGFRIELGEIEHLLKKQRLIRDAVVSVVDKQKKYLVASIIPAKLEDRNPRVISGEKEIATGLKEHKEIRNQIVEKCLFYMLLANRPITNMQLYLQKYKRKNAVACLFDWLEKREIICLSGNKIKEGKRWDVVQSTKLEEMPLGKEIMRNQEIILAILRGEKSENDFMQIPIFNPERLLFASEIVTAYMNKISKELIELGKKSGVKKKIGFFNVRSGYLLKNMIASIKDYYNIVLFDQSPGMLHLAKETLHFCDTPMEFRQLSDRYIEGKQVGEFDYIITINALHQYIDCHTGIQQAELLLKNNGYLWGMEYTDIEAMALISSAILEDGFKKYEKKRKQKYNPFLASDEWEEIFKETNFEIVRIENDSLNSVLAWEAFKGAGGSEWSEDAIKQYVSQKLPEYMRPEEYFYFREFPLNQNGKIDRKKVIPKRLNVNSSTEAPNFKSDMEKQVSEMWKELMEHVDIGSESNFFEIGGDSLIATRFMNLLLKKYNINFKLGEIFERPKLFQIAQAIEEKLEDVGELIEGEI